ncbi:MAG: S49 family peptidase [Propionibacteriaceae bacterium]|jgi:protease-4|nr:S49 family peptidase [Propionibacteriaceae bacterium]
MTENNSIDNQSPAAGQADPVAPLYGSPDQPSTAADTALDATAATTAPDPYGTAPSAQGPVSPTVDAPPPDVQAPAAKPPKPNRGFLHGLGLGAGAGAGFAIVLTIGSILSTIIMAATFAVLLSTNLESGENLETVWGKETAAKTIRAFRVNGMILADSSSGGLADAGTYGYEIAVEIDKLDADDADGLLLLMNTPGGVINGSWAIADAVSRYQERTGHKVAAYVEGESASGGMLAMAGADVIYADHGAWIGSIGVYIGPLQQYKNVTGVDGGILSGGVTAEQITQEYITKGDGKTFGDPYRPLTESERAMLEDSIEAPYEQFVAHVSQGRGIPADTIKNVFGAHIFDASDAAANHLIDAELDRVDAFRQIAKDFGLNPDDVKIEAPTTPGVLETLLGASARVPGVAPAASAGGLSQAVCGSTPTALVFAGDRTAVCG